MRSHVPLSALIAVGSIVGGSFAEIVYDESVDGDLSDDHLAPTSVAISEGFNTFVFTTDREGDDRDIFTVEIAAGYVLSDVILDLFDTNADDPNNLGFIGFSAGSVLGTNPDGPNPAGLLGYGLVFESDSGSSIFDAMANGGGAQGYDGPLDAGPYTFWAQETSPTIDDWRITLVVTPVPGPGALALAAVAGVMNRRRREATRDER